MEMSQQAAVDFYSRRDRIFDQAIVENTGAQAIVLFSAKDIHYLTGMREGIQCLMVTRMRMVAITTCMFESEVKLEAPHCELVVSSPDPRFRYNIYQFTIEELLRRDWLIVAYDASQTTVMASDELHFHSRLHPIILHPVRDLTVRPRAIKDPWELHQIQRCISIAEEAFLKLIEPGIDNLIGMTEREIAWELEGLMRLLGAERQGFPGTGLIVASGPNSASVHPKPSDRTIRSGEALLIDWGAELNEYRSDSTRTVFPGGIPDWAEKALPTVIRALEAAVQELRPEAPVKHADLAARAVITGAGFPEFTYGVGHGVGLLIHEAPWIRPESSDPFAMDMITTIEPGIYLPGIGGIRIENIYHIQESGAKRMGTLPAAFPFI